MRESAKAEGLRVRVKGCEGEGGGGRRRGLWWEGVV